jgi:endonuclease/exonuclease/phosphatase family metal-dependent hydrolase
VTSGDRHGLPAGVTRTRLLAHIAAVTVAALLAVSTGSCSTTRPEHGTAAPAVLAAEPVRAMTFNIRYGTARDGDHAWPLRRHLAFRTIREYAPTVLGLQEVLRFQLDEIGAELPHLSEIGVGRDDGAEAGEYTAILYDGRRLEPIDQGTFWLSDTPDVPGSTSWGNRITRIATWARFLDRANGAGFYVFNTHWDHESQPARERSAALLLERIRDRGAADPVILMGDFNAGEENRAFQALVSQSEVRLYDTFRAVHHETVGTGTYHAFTGDRSGPKIDAILATPAWHSLDAEIVLLSENGLYPSDHFPVTATLTLRSRGH